MTAGIAGGRVLGVIASVWLALLALGMWRIRSIPDQRKWFRGWFATLLPLAASIALIAFRRAGAAVTGDPAALRHLNLFEGVALGSLLLAWISALVLIRFGRRPGLLLFSVIVMPVLTFGPIDVLWGRA
jgi:hypothetical protein